MKRLILLIFCYLTTALLSCLLAQTVTCDQDFEKRASTLIEEIVLLTDRSIYAVEEEVHFKASYFTNTDFGDREWSTVLYLELVRPDGTAFVQKKYALSSSGAEGSFYIPKTVLTGDYYLRAYTKWMRNFDVEHYGYCKLKLINPHTAVVETSETINDNKKEPVDLWLKNNIDINLTTPKEKYGRREKVEVTIRSEEAENEEKEYCVSVVRKGTKIISGTHLNRNNNLLTQKNTINYYPEVRSITLSGKVLRKGTQQLAKEAMVYLSLLNGPPYFSGYKTNDKGEFFFSIPKFYGDQDFFITAEKDSLSLDIKLDDDFCTRELSLPAEEFNLSKADRLLAQELCVNAQISKAYAERDSVRAVNLPNKAYSFNGTSKRKIYTKDYIDLPNIEEFIFELVPEISIVYKKKEPTIRTSIQNSLSNYPVLVMLDNIPVSNLKQALKITADNIEYIEVIASGYVIGSLKYSGVINVFSKKGDFAGIDLPNNSRFFSHRLFSSPKESHAENEYVEILPKRISDRRNCLYWNPDFQINSGLEKKISFYTSDLKGEYQILVQIVSQKTGEISFAEKIITVF